MRCAGVQGLPPTCQRVGGEHKEQLVLAPGQEGEDACLADCATWCDARLGGYHEQHQERGGGEGAERVVLHLCGVEREFNAAGADCCGEEREGGTSLAAHAPPNKGEQERHQRGEQERRESSAHEELLIGESAVDQCAREEELCRRVGPLLGDGKRAADFCDHGGSADCGGAANQQCERAMATVAREAGGHGGGAGDRLRFEECHGDADIVDVRDHGGDGARFGDGRCGHDQQDANDGEADASRHAPGDGARVTRRCCGEGAKRSYVRATYERKFGGDRLASSERHSAADMKVGVEKVMRVRQIARSTTR